MNRDNIYDQAIAEVFDMVNKLKERVTNDYEVLKQISDKTKIEYDRQHYLGQKQDQLKEKQKVLAQRGARMADVKRKYKTP